MTGRLQNVHLRINDAATGQPTPVRLRITDEATGTYFTPYGRLTADARGWERDPGGDVRIEGVPWTCLDGSCEIALPTTRLRFEVWKGFEYQPLDERLDLIPGKMAVRLTMHRAMDLKQQGLYSGDLRCHNLSPHAALLEGAGEDLAFVNLLAYESSMGDCSNLVAFSGQESALERWGHQVVVNTWNQERLGLGSLALLNCHRVVHPLSIDTLHDWSLDDWCHQCHRKHGLAVWTPTTAQESWLDGMAEGEALAHLILGHIDVLEIRSQEQLTDYLYPLLAVGCRPLIGGASGRQTNATPLGQTRTYVHLGIEEPVSYTRWIEGLRAGRAVVSMGPLPLLLADEHGPGATLQRQPGDPPIRVRSVVHSHVPYERVEIVYNGEIVAAEPVGPLSGTTSLSCEFTPATTGWLAARCIGPAPDQRIVAHSNVIHLAVAGAPQRIDRSLQARLLAKLDASRQYLAEHGHFSAEKQRTHRLEFFQQARARLMAVEQE